MELDLDTVGSTQHPHPIEWKAIFDFASIGLMVVNAEGRILNINQIAESMFGYATSELWGVSVDLLLPANVRHEHASHRAHFFKTPSQRLMGKGRDLVAQRKDGSLFPVEVSLGQYTLNEQPYVLVSIIDISQRKAAELAATQQRDELMRCADEIKKLNRELEHKIEQRTRELKDTLADLQQRQTDRSSSFENEKHLLDLKSRFITMASHEFRTPLSTILSSVSLIARYKKTEDSEKREKHISRIKLAVADMKGILEDFLSLGKLDEGKVELRQEEFSADELKEKMGEILAEMQRLAKRGQTIEYDHQIDQCISMDMSILRHILTNLVSNAIKFSFELSPISVTGSISGKELVISIKDKGIGISEKDQRHLFERFFRAENAANIQGTGLGLHIVARYLSLAEGRWEVQSKLNEGTTVTVYLPLS